MKKGLILIVIIIAYIIGLFVKYSFEKDDYDSLLQCHANNGDLSKNSLGEFDCKR